MNETKKEILGVLLTTPSGYELCHFFSNDREVKGWY